MDEEAKERVVERLMKAFSAWYDIQENFEFSGRPFRTYGEFHSFGERYVLSRRAKLWEINTHDHLFIASVDVLTVSCASEYISFLTSEGLGLVGPRKDQMSSNLTLIFVAEAIDDEASKLLRKTRFRKNYRFGLEGWTDLRLAAIDLKTGSVIVNGAARDLRKTLLANARLG